MDKRILDKRNNSDVTKKGEKLRHEGHNSSKFSSNFISSLQPKKDKSSTRPSKMYSMLTTVSSSKTDKYWNWTFLPLPITIIRMSQTYGTFILILFGCFCFGLTAAKKECQGMI